MFLKHHPLRRPSTIVAINANEFVLPSSVPGLGLWIGYALCGVYLDPWANLKIAPGLMLHTDRDVVYGPFAIAVQSLGILFMRRK